MINVEDHAAHCRMTGEIIINNTIPPGNRQPLVLLLVTSKRISVFRLEVDANYTL